MHSTILETDPRRRPALSYARCARLAAAILCAAVACSAFPEAPPEGARPYRQLAAYNFRAGAPAQSRVGAPPQPALEYLRELDGLEYTPYTPDARELELIRRCIAALPRLHAEILQRRVVGLYFINDFASNGLTDWVLDKDGGLYAFIVFHPRTLNMTVAELLTSREQTIFIPDDSGLEVKIRMSGEDPAWLYILLHEMAHVADLTLRISPYIEPAVRTYQERLPSAGNYIAPYWANYNTPRPAYDYALRREVTFYGFNDGPKIPLAEAPRLYAQLKESPFASVYGSQIWAEDLAELMSLYHLSEKLGRDYVIEVRRGSRLVVEYRPFKENEALRARLADLQMFY